MKNKPVDDLEYLSQLGFEKIPVSETDLRDLKKRVRARFIYTQPFYLIAICLVLGALMGAGAFYLISPGTAQHVEYNRGAALPAAPMKAAESRVTTFELDTIDVIQDHFIKPAIAHYSVDQATPDAAKFQDTLQVVPLPATSIPATLMEQKIKFMINSPVVFIHDLKVSDYTTLYFKKNQFVKFSAHTGTSADYAGKNESQLANAMQKQRPDYFLHQELADGLLYFKQRKYDACIIALNDVAGHNKTDVNCDFYLGMCYYHKKNYSKALQYFERCIENLNNAFLQEATYYKAQALLNQGNKREAILLLKNVAEEGEFYSDKAKADLAHL